MGWSTPTPKWQVQSDQVIFDMGLKQCQQIPHLSYLHVNNELVLVVAKIVHNLKAASEGDHAAMFINKFIQKLELGTLLPGFGKMGSFKETLIKVMILLVAHMQMINLRIWMSISLLVYVKRNLTKPSNRLRNLVLHLQTGP